MTEAEKVYQRFIENHSTSFLGYNQLAWLYAKQAIKLHEALELANKADELRPENASVNDTLGWIYFHKQVYTQAYDYLQKANNISKSNNPDILFHLAAVEFRQGHVKNAKAHLEQAIQLSDSFESINEAKKLLTDIQTAASRTVD
jgi:tetratricopeptide (TPR) repeat protein